MTFPENFTLRPAQHYDKQALLTEQQVADRQRRSVKTLRNQRVTGGGIPFLKLGRTVRYRLSDVLAWETARLVSSTSELPTSPKERFGEG